MSAGIPGAEWAAIDRSSDPAGYVRYLDTVSGLTAAQAYKRQIVAQLDIHEGDQVLDVGCGNGDDARIMAQVVGPTGRVVGIDQSIVMVDEARKRAEGSNLREEYHVADAHHLPFPDNTFDCSRADRTFQHLEDPTRALAEMIRTSRSGARIVIADPDWETMVVDAPNRVVTRKILNFRCDMVRNGWIGRQLFALFRVSGLTNVTVIPTIWASTDYDLVDQLASLREVAARLSEAGGITSDEAAASPDELARAGQEGRFLAAIAVFVVAGRKL